MAKNYLHTIHTTNIVLSQKGGILNTVNKGCIFSNKNLH